jgi:hypothetical protein
MHSYMRLLTEGAIGLRSLMTSALALLIDLSASQAPDYVRIWASRSDLSPHHLNGLALCRRVPWHHAGFKIRGASGTLTFAP